MKDGGEGARAWRSHVKVSMSIQPFIIALNLKLKSCSSTLDWPGAKSCLSHVTSRTRKRLGLKWATGRETVKEKGTPQTHDKQVKFNFQPV